MGTQPCQQPRCKLCPHINTNDRLTDFLFLARFIDVRLFFCLGFLLTIVSADYMFCSHLVKPASYWQKLVSINKYNVSTGMLVYVSQRVSSFLTVYHFIYE